LQHALILKPSSPLPRAEIGRISFSVRTFTAETGFDSRWGAAIKTSGYAGHAAIGVIAGTLNVTAYRGQCAFAPEL
jgi:hypothetical protein